MDFQLFNAQTPGLIIIGTEQGCGKTLVTAGIAAAVRELGYSTRALKPLVLGSRKRSESELSFISSVAQTPINYPILFLDRPISIHQTNWHKTILLSRAANTLTVLELPGGCATPVCFDETNSGRLSTTWRDATDLVLEFKLPCVLVAKHQSDAVERLVSCNYYLTGKGATVLGLVTSETQPDAGVELESRQTRSDFVAGLLARTGVPYLGCLKFSPMVSVPRANPGNVVKLVSVSLDLNVILKALNIPLSV